ncbi:MAG: type II pantothenate kinase [Lachnospiraceae bacterium]|nr:type II pantothenate kinase [Lachnospiraceae bacterium]
MGVRIGIDIGSSTTKIVAFEQERMLAPMVVRADSQMASLYGAFGQYLYENRLELSDVDGVYTTGIGSKYVDKRVYGCPTFKIDEFVATGTGGYYLTDKKEVIVVSMGTGSFFVKVTETEMKHLGGVGLGGGSICGLSSIMLNTDDINEISALSRKGDVAKIDLRIGDLAKEKLPGLNLDVTASNFGKADAQSKLEDIAAGIVHMVIENICQSAILASSGTGIKDYILIGGLTKFFECRQITSAFRSLWDVEISIPEYSDFATAIGAVIAAEQAQEIK